MNKKKLGTTDAKTKAKEGKENGKEHAKEEKTYKRPSWVKSGEEELCPDCFKVVGDKSRYNMVCMLGNAKEGMTVGEITAEIKLAQPTVTHHLNVLRSVDAVGSEDRGRERIYKLNREAHCFEDCQIPFE